MYTDASISSDGDENTRWEVGKSLFWSLGIFAVIFIILCLLFALYFLIHHFRKKYSVLKYAEIFLLKKLFFGSPIRFMFVGYLKIAHNSIFFLFLQSSSETGRDKAQLVLNIFLVVFIVLLPLVITVVLLIYRERLEQPNFKNKFHSLYLDTKTDSYLGETLKTNR